MRYSYVLWNVLLSKLHDMDVQCLEASLHPQNKKGYSPISYRLQVILTTMELHNSSLFYDWFFINNYNADIVEATLFIPVAFFCYLPWHTFSLHAQPMMSLLYLTINLTLTFAHNIQRSRSCQQFNWLIYKGLYMQFLSCLIVLANHRWTKFSKTKLR